MKDVSIIVPHYKTPYHLDMCIKLIRYYTRRPYQLIVVDNGSDESEVEFVSCDPGVVFIRRQQESMDMAAHAQALDAGIERATGEYIVTLHSDTFVTHEGWLSFLIERLEKGGYDIVGPATHKLYVMNWRERLMHFFKGSAEPEMVRPVFAIYKREIFENRRFSEFDDVGGISKEYVKARRVGFISRDEACKYVFHLGGTTKLTNLAHRRKAQRKKSRQFEAFLERPEVRMVLNR